MLGPQGNRRQSDFFECSLFDQRAHQMKQRPAYTLAEELAHAITHGVGLALSVAGLIVLVVAAVRYGSVWHIVGCSIFGAALVLTYTASTLYHSLPSQYGKSIFQRLDHSAIFLLIAGTYTPFTLVTLRGPWGWSLLSTVWAVAIFGIGLQFTSFRWKRVVSIILYVALGWVVVVAIKPMMAAIATGGLLLIALGGIVYTVGIVFYGMKRRYAHAVWHVFVMAGSALHFFAVFKFVVPR